MGLQCAWRKVEMSEDLRRPGADPPLCPIQISEAGGGGGLAQGLGGWLC